jgi:hypothetical protein
MIEVSQEEWLAALRPGDIGINLSRNPFAVMQSWYRKRFKEGEEKASHGFILESPPDIIEANGVFTKRARLIKFIGGKTKVWIFRNHRATAHDIRLMLAVAAANVDGGGHYSVFGIMQMAGQFFGIDKKITDKAGNFCTELTSRCIHATDLPYIRGADEELMPAHMVTPSLQLNWMLGYGKRVDWVLGAYYDGAGKFWLWEPSDQRRGPLNPGTAAPPRQ